MSGYYCNELDYFKSITRTFNFCFCFFRWDYGRLGVSGGPPPAALVYGGVLGAAAAHRTAVHRQSPSCKYFPKSTSWGRTIPGTFTGKIGTWLCAAHAREDRIWCDPEPRGWRGLDLQQIPLPSVCKFSDVRNSKLKNFGCDQSGRRSFYENLWLRFCFHDVTD